MLWRHVYALETCVCSGDMIYAVWTCYMLYGHVFLLEKNIWCLLVGEEYVFLLETNICLLVEEEYVFLLEKNIWIWKMSSCWRRIDGYGRCVLVG